MPGKEPMEENVEEVDEEVDMVEAPPTGDSVPEQEPALPVALLAVARIWAGGPSDQVARRGPDTSLKARGKAPAIQAE